MLIKAGQTLVKEGEKSNQLFWLIEGELEVVQNVRDHEAVVNTIKSGELVGELSFLDQKPRSATVRAKTDSQLIVLEYKDFQKMLAAQPKWMKKILITLTSKIRKLSKI